MSFLRKRRSRATAEEVVAPPEQPLFSVNSFGGLVSLSFSTPLNNEEIDRLREQGFTLTMLSATLALQGRSLADVTDALTSVLSGRDEVPSEELRVVHNELVGD